MFKLKALFTGLFTNSRIAELTSQLEHQLEVNNIQNAIIAKSDGLKEAYYTSISISNQIITTLKDHIKLLEDSIPLTGTGVSTPTNSTPTAEIAELPELDLDDLENLANVTDESELDMLNAELADRMHDPLDSHMLLVFDDNICSLSDDVFDDVLDLDDDLDIGFDDDDLNNE